MKSSNTIKEISEALVEAQKNIGAAPKDKNNPFFQSKYADLGDVIAVCKEALLAQGISVLQLPGFDERGHTLETVLLHRSGEFIATTMRLNPVATARRKKDDSNESANREITPADYGNALTYARRQALQAIILIPAVDDDQEWAEKALSHRPQDESDLLAMQEILEQYLREAEDAKSDNMKQRYLGLAAEMRCKIEDKKLEIKKEADKEPQSPKKGPIVSPEGLDSRKQSKRATEAPVSEESNDPDDWQDYKIQCVESLKGKALGLMSEKIIETLWERRGKPNLNSENEILRIEAKKIQKAHEELERIKASRK